MTELSCSVHSMQTGTASDTRGPLQHLVAQNLREFKDQLFQMWFRPYTREARDDSSGFEHGAPSTPLPMLVVQLLDTTRRYGSYAACD